MVFSMQGEVCLSLKVSGNSLSSPPTPSVAPATWALSVVKGATGLERGLVLGGLWWLSADWGMPLGECWVKIDWVWGKI